MPDQPNCHTQQRHIGQLTYFFLTEFGVPHGFFTRHGGRSHGPYDSLNTAMKTDDPNAPRNRSVLIDTLGIDPKNLVILRPCHGNSVQFIDSWCPGSNSPTVLKNTDAAFCKNRRIIFMVSSADCLILMITDTHRSFCGILHAGWRNLVNGFVTQTLKKLIIRYGIHPDDIRIGLGPCIYPCCYIFHQPQQLNDPFWHPFFKSVPGRGHAIDLVSAMKTQLFSLGIEQSHILETGLCTGCRTDLFFSCYQQGYVSGRFPTLIGHGLALGLDGYAK